jgi:serine protein kinase
MQESFRIEQKKVIEVIARNLVFYESELSDDDAINTPMSRENRQQIESVVENLCQKYQYSRNGAISLIKALIKERY